MYSSKDVALTVEKLLKRLEVEKDGLVLVHESDGFDPFYSKIILDGIQSHMKDGTVCVFGDCEFNSDVLVKDMVPYISNQERLVLSSGKMMQLMTLQQECIYVTHPSLMIATAGKFSRYFGRPTEMDFPYGAHSVFTDFYDLNATLILVGDVLELFEAKFAYATLDHHVIRKTACLKDKSVMTYLDIVPNYTRIHDLVFNSKLLLYEQLDGQYIYGIKYRDFIDYLKEVL